MIDAISLVGRTRKLFANDLRDHDDELRSLVESSKFLVVGGAGSIGQAVVKEIFRRKPKLLHVVDVSENNLVELVRDLRSTLGYISGDFDTYALDCNSIEFSKLMSTSPTYDYVLNLSALKHVRSEKDPYSILRMIQVNIFNSVNLAKLAFDKGAKKYFCVSTDKAANPVNMMGASKRIMELFLMRESEKLDISMARFANVAFSDGSLLHGFSQRVSKKQPLSAPSDVKRYFLSMQEAGELCLFSCLLGKSREIFYPKLSKDLHLETFSNIAVKFVKAYGYEPFICDSEEEARVKAKKLIEKKYWPCHFFISDTTGEKPVEEFHTDDEALQSGRFHEVGVIKNSILYDDHSLNSFSVEIDSILRSTKWQKSEILRAFNNILPNFEHVEKDKNLNERM